MLPQTCARTYNVRLTPVAVSDAQRAGRRLEPGGRVRSWAWLRLLEPGGTRVGRGGAASMNMNMNMIDEVAGGRDKMQAKRRTRCHDKAYQHYTGTLQNKSSPVFLINSGGLAARQQKDHYATQEQRARTVLDLSCIICDCEEDTSIDGRGKKGPWQAFTAVNNAWLPVPFSSESYLVARRRRRRRTMERPHPRAVSHGCACVRGPSRRVRS